MGTVPYIATSIHTICSTRSTLPSLPSMAKSLRSKSKRAFRRVKREDPKSDYAIRDKIRLQRLNGKLKVLTPVDRSDDEDEEEEVFDGDGMQEDKPEGEAASSAKPKPAKSTTTGAASVTKGRFTTDNRPQSLLSGLLLSPAKAAAPLLLSAGRRCPLT